MSRIHLAIVVVLAVLALSKGARAVTVYVDDSAPAGGTGLFWSTPFKHLQDALTYAAVPANNVTEIRLGQGVYKPDRTSASPGGTGSRNATFQLRNGLSIKGGYAGFGAPIPDTRNITGTPSILTGDLLSNDNNSANIEEDSLHVVTGSGNNSTAVLDGVRVMSGYAGLVGGQTNGGGVFISAGSPTFINCTIDRNHAQNLGAGVYLASASNATFTGCTINFNKTYQGGFGSNGGGVYVTASNPSFSNCTFQNNTVWPGAAGGGAMFNLNSSPSISNCTFTNNGDPGSLVAAGGAIYNSNSSPTISNCVFTNNRGTAGGGVYNTGGGIPIIRQCQFSLGWAESGGGIHNGSTNARISLCSFINIPAEGGGAISNSSASPRIDNCFFAGNRATIWGGGAIWNTGTSAPVFVNCNFSYNRASTGGFTSAGGVVLNQNTSSPQFINCAFNANSGAAGGIASSAGGVFTFTNCILRNSTPSHFSTSATTVNISYSNVEGGFIGTSNISTDPRFMDTNGPDNFFGTADDNLHIYYGSPCIDAGINSALPADITDLDADANTAETVPIDLDGLSRLVDDLSVSNTGVGSPPVDMGPYEVRIPANIKLWMTGAGDFGTPTKWIPNGAPTNADTAVLHRPTPGEAVVFNAPSVSNKLDIGAGIWSFLLQGNTYTISSAAPDGMTVGSVPDFLSEMRIYGPGLITVPNTLIKHGILCGYGTLQSNVVNISLVSPGGDGGFGQLTIDGTYSQVGTLNGTPTAGYLECDIGGTVPGTSFDQLVVTGTGTATLGGALRVHLIGGYQPPIGSLFTVLTAGSITGSFDLAFMPAINDGGTPRFLHPVYQYGLNDGRGGIAGGSAVLVVVDPLPTALDFGNPNSVNVPGAPTSAAAGDFDGINGVDIAITINGSPINLPGSLIILLNNGSGVFTVQPAQPQVGAQPRSIAVGQLNADSNLDIAVANFGGNSVTVRFNSGGANFSGAPTTISNVGLQPVSIAAAKLDANSSTDLVVANAGSNDALVLINNGAGVYSNGPLLPGGNNPVSVDPADVDNDRDVDIVLGSSASGNVTLHSNNGAGTFSPAGTVSLGGDPVDIIVSNVNNDPGDLPEIVSANYNAGTVSILVNQGGFNFAPAVTIPAGTKPRSLVSVNLDGDGDLDLAVVTDDATLTPVVRVLRNDLNGGSQLVFTVSEDLFTGSNTKFVLTGEADASPGADLIAVDTDTGSLNDGGGIAGVTNSVSLLPNLTIALCIGDIAPIGPPLGNGTVNVDDLLAVINSWGACPPPCPPQGGCRADIAPEGGNCAVNVDDLLAVINNWGLCP